MIQIAPLNAIQAALEQICAEIGMTIISTVQQLSDVPVHGLRQALLATLDQYA